VTTKSKFVKRVPTGPCWEEHGTIEEKTAMKDFRDLSVSNVAIETTSSVCIGLFYLLPEMIAGFGHPANRGIESIQ